MFDKGSKGFLTEKEQRIAKEAIKHGLESNFVWNVEQAGCQRPYRLLQKRGKIIDSEDFQTVRDTYPDFPKQNKVTLDPNGGDDLMNTKNSKNINDNLLGDFSQSPKRTFRSKTEMEIYRREENVRTLNLLKDNWDAKHPKDIPMTYKKSEFLVKNPAHTSKGQIHELLNKEARIKAGLNAVSSNISYLIL